MGVDARVTVVGIECNSATFLMSFQEGSHQKLFFQQNSASKMANCIIVAIYCQFSYVITGKLLGTHS